MKKKLIFGVCILCVGTVMTALAGVGVLAMQGKITNSTITEILAVIDGEYQPPAIEDESTASIQSSREDIDLMRVNRSYGEDNRRTELDRMSILLIKRGAKLLEDQRTDKVEREAYNDKMAKLTQDIESESKESARAILLKMSSEDAVASLMSVSLEENILLLKGMQEKKIAEILQEFMKSRDTILVKRGQDIFQAISQGEPENKLVKNALDDGKADLK